MATSNINGNPLLASGLEVQVIRIGGETPVYYKKGNYAAAESEFAGPYSILVIGYECVKIFSSINTDQTIGYSSATSVVGGETSVVTIEDGKLKFTQSNRQYMVFSPKQTRLVKTTNS